MRSRGFTLLELMVAVVILGVVIVASLRAISVGLIASRDAADYTVAVNLAQQKIEETTQETQFDTGETTGTFDAPFDSYSWDSDIETTTVENLYHVRVTVLWQLGQRQRSMSLETVLYPAPPPGTTTAGGTTTGAAPASGGAPQP